MKTVWFLLFFIGYQVASAEEFVYDMSVFGFKFGRMVVSRIALNDSTEQYSLVAHGKTNFLWMKREDETRQVVVYQNGKLLSSDYLQMESGVKKHWTKVQWNGKDYDVDSDRGKRKFSESPLYSVLSLYFSPHAQRSKIFYEAESTYITPKYTSKNTVELVGRENSKTIYHFAEGEVQKIEVHLSIATVMMERAN